MGHVRWLFVIPMCFLPLLTVTSAVEGLGRDSKVRGVNLGGWLVIEEWIKPSLFEAIPNGDMLDGTQVQFKSTMLQKFVSAAGGGGGEVTVDRDFPSVWETFRMWRISDTKFQFRSSTGQFLTCGEDGNMLSATAKFPSVNETFSIERNHDKVHIRSSNGNYIQATASYQLKSDYSGVYDWENNSATFQMTIVANTLHGDYQLANGYGKKKAREVLKKISGLA